MMHLFLDANILVDVAIKRIDAEGKPLWLGSMLLLDDIAKKKHRGTVSALSLYIVSVLVNPKDTKAGDLLARQKIRGFTEFLEKMDLTSEVLDESLQEARLRFEDALQFVAARKAGAEAIVTRNVKHFKKVSEEVNVLTPEDLVRFSDSPT